MVESSWNIYLPSIILIFGAVIVSWSLYRGVKKVLKESADPMRALVLVRHLRTGLAGLSLVGIGAGWLGHIESLLFLSLIFGCEELYETSVVIAVLKRSLRESGQEVQA